MKNILAILFFCLIAVVAQAHSFKSGTVDIGHPWAKPTAPDALNGEVYLGFMNMGDKADQLLGASTSIAHKVVLNDGQGTVQSIALPVMQGVPMRPGAAHITLQGLKGGLTEGDKFTLRLTFANAQPVDVVVFVQNTPTENATGHKGH